MTVLLLAELLEVAVLLLRHSRIRLAWALAFITLGCATGEEPTRDSWSIGSGGTGGTQGASGTAGVAGEGGQGGAAGIGPGGSAGSGGAVPSCDDGIQNQDEEGIDCGGVCPPCEGTCDDGIQNQGEEGIDCGGPCPACPTCDDGIQNQGEEGIDCGGPCPACPTCDDGIQNQGEEGIDCGGPCPACPTCDDGIQNQGEEGIDCGGPCPACPTCDDGIQNQGETGIDCGGPCPACPTCDDGIQNQGETGIDCGGPCPPCGFTHQENFNTFPTWGLDGAYTATGSCNNQSGIDGWVLTNYVYSSFPQSTSFYAAIDTTAFAYWGYACDDFLRTPILSTSGASTVTIDFDTDLKIFLNTTASVLLELDGAVQTVWTRTSDLPGQHVTIGPLSTGGASQLRVHWRYQGTYEFYWRIDNIVIKGL